MSELNITTVNTAKSAWEGMLADIDKAETSIVYEQYIIQYASDGQLIGSQFVDAFCRAAKRGVSVRLLLDAQGSLGMLKSDEVRQCLKEAGVSLHFYRTAPFAKLVNPFRLFLRDHRKVLLIDQKISWIGGVVIGEDFRDWSDYAWRIDSLRFGAKLSVELDNQQTRLESGEILLASFTKAFNGIHLVGNAPGIGNRHIYEQICQNLLLAETDVFMVTPYFVPPLRLRRVIRQKLKEGVRVCLLIPDTSDHQIADWARWQYLKKLAIHGLEVWVTSGMNHAKIVTSDKTWATFGSANLDYLSLIFNHEFNIDCSDERHIDLIGEQINSWLDTDYRRLNLNELFKRQPTLIHRIIGFILRPLV